MKNNIFEDYNIFDNKLKQNFPNSQNYSNV